MAEFVKVANKTEIEEDRGTVFSVKDKEVALFLVEGTYYAINNTCPHAEGPLGEGDLEDKVVTCPWHGWQFDVSTGAGLTDEETHVSTYPVKVEGDDIYVEI